MAKKATLVIVDREKIIVDLLTRALATAKLAVFGTTTAEAAAKLIDLHGADVLVIDPSIQNGLALASSVRANFKNTKIIAITGSDDLRQSAHAQGIEAIVDRNSGLDALSATIQRYVDADLSGLDRSGVRVLVADDEEALCNVLSEFLAGRGYSVTLAKNGREAVERVSADRNIQIVLLDVAMPEMGGIEALNIIMSRDPHPNVIMMTAVADREIARQAMRTGAFDYIIKPLDFAAIESSITACLSHSEYQKQPWWKRLTGR